MAPIADSSASKTWHHALAAASARCAFLGEAARKFLCAKRSRRVQRSRKANASVPVIEGRISVPACGRGMKRCLAEGSDQLELWVGAAILANNLMIIALLTKRSTRRRRDAG
jgi:hypothetical protein